MMPRRTWGEWLKSWRSTKLLWGVASLLCLLFLYSGWSVLESYRTQSIVNDWQARGIYTTSLIRDPDWLMQLDPRIAAVVRRVIPHHGVDGLTVVANRKSRLGDRTLFTHGDIRKLNKIRTLRSLSIEDYPITDEDLLQISQVYRLKDLQFTGSDVSDSGIGHLRHLEQLNRLSMNGTLKISVKGLAQLAKLPELNALYLGDTPVTDEGVAEICRMKNLQSLTLDGSQLTEKGLQQLDQMETLLVLTVFETKLTAKSLPRLRTRLGPDLSLYQPL